MTSRLLSCIFIIAWALSAAPAVAQPAPPPQDPILRIDPGMHTARISRMGADTACSLLATASDDKTVRLWHLPEGKLLRTLRPPIGPGNDGKAYSVAMAPDGSWIAVGGWDAAYSSMRANFVYIFHGVTGAVTARLGPLGDVINHLAVSPDGRYLAGTVGGGLGLRVWERTGADLASWRLIAEDKDYGGEPAYGAAFDRSGALYTVAYDTKLRRYAPGYQAKPTWVTTPGGKGPLSLAVHPSGDRIVVGYYDSTAVEIYDALSLALRMTVDTKRVDNGHIGRVTWSADGSRLYAGGTYPIDRRSSILVWQGSGEGDFRELDGPQDSIFHLLPCGSGLAMAGGDPAFGLFTAEGARSVWHDAVVADMRGQYGEMGLSVSADGRRVRFGLQQQKEPVLFDLASERLSDAPERSSDLTGADTKSLPVTSWNHEMHPKLGGTPIRLLEHEIARSLAIAPDKQRFVLGTEWQLRTYDKNGKEVWRRTVPEVAWGVNIAAGGKLVIGAHADGTIRWHRLSDGEELLALFVHKVDRRWVAWTPKGYYIASPGAEGLIGWHVNRGWNEAAQFFSVDRFRDQFNRPDIVKLVLETLDEGKAIEEANKRAKVRRGIEDVRAIAPPMVVIQKPGDGSTFRSQEVTLEYDVFSPTGQKITKVDYLINNAALGARFVAPVDTGKFAFSGRVTLPLPSEDVTITVVAYEGTRASEPVSVRLRWDGAKAGQVTLPRLRGLFVGVNAYTSPKLAKLGYAAKDATDLATFFKAQERKSYTKVESKVLPEAKRADVLDGLEWLEKGSEEGDINMLFLAGHGVTIDHTFYYMAADSDPDRARATAISRDEILQTIRQRKGAMVVMLDACHSGASTDAPPAGSSRVDMNRLANELGDKSLGVLLYASARGRQFSYERADWGNGAFTRAVLDGLAGAADSAQLGYIDTEELSLYVRRRVMAMTKGLQEPVRVKPDAAPEMRIVLLK